MKIDKAALKQACINLAESVLWRKGPRSIKPSQDFAMELYEIAVSHEDFIIEQGNDPNFIVRAVRYIGHAHAIPSANYNKEWFTITLETIIELGCPNTKASQSNEKFYQEITAGIEQARSEYNQKNS